MSEYHPHGWVVLKIIAPNETLYKVFASWSGGYTQGESWKMNSGITGCYMEVGGDYYYFTGYSGSTYACSKHAYNRINAYNQGILNQLLKDAHTQNCVVTVMDEDTDWCNMEWAA